MGHAEFWLLKDRKIILAYMSSDAAEREVQHFHYSFPKHEGQIVISRRYHKIVPNIVPEMLKMTAIIKYLTPYFILDLNEKLYQNGGWGTLYKSDRGFENSHSEEIGVVYLDRSSYIVQNTSNNIALDAVKNRFYKTVWDSLITTSIVTCVSDALGLHIDEPKSNPILKGNEGFVETRVLIPIHFLSTSNMKHLPLGRGGGGLGVFITALIDYSFSSTQKIGGLQNYKDFRK